MLEDLKNNTCFASGSVAVDDYWKSRGVQGANETDKVENLRASAWETGEKGVQSDGFFSEREVSNGWWVGGVGFRVVIG